MNITRVGVDIEAYPFEIYAVDRHDQCQWRGHYKSERWLAALCERVPVGAEIGMEDCAAAHYWGRELERRGYRVKLLPAEFAKPYVKSKKYDWADAETICGAMSRPTMRTVAVKSVAQQDMPAAHRICESLVDQRTAKVSQIQELVGAFGLIAPVGIRALLGAIPDLLEDPENGLTDGFRSLLSDLADDLRILDERVGALDEQIALTSSD